MRLWEEFGATQCRQNLSTTLDSALPYWSHVKGTILDLFFACYNAHPPCRIWQFPPAIKTANVIESVTIAVRPRCVTMDAIKQVSQNPFDPLHGHMLSKVGHTLGVVTLRVWDLSGRRMNCLSFLRARADWAFTVPCGIRRIRAVSRIERPSISRN